MTYLHLSREEKRRLNYLNGVTMQGEHFANYALSLNRSECEFPFCGSGAESKPNEPDQTSVKK